MTGVTADYVRRVPQPVRFVLAGGFAAGVNWLARFPFSAFMPFAAAVLLATLVGMCIGFVLYQMTVFPESGRPLLMQLRDFAVVNVLATAIVVAVAVVSEPVLLLGIDAAPAQALAHAFGIAAGAAANFFGHRAWTFRPAAAPGRRTAEPWSHGP